MFDKSGRSSAYFQLVGFAICAAIVINRVSRSIIILPSVHYASLVYETMLSWLMIR